MALLGPHTVDDIKLQNIQFAYPSRPERCILHDISLVIRANSITCFVGSSGSGKSTLVKLICGLQAPQRGKISIGSRTISSMGISQQTEELISNMQWLRDNFGVVQQTDSSLLSGTIAENIEYGKVALLLVVRQHIRVSKRASCVNYFADGCESGRN